jgi:hypothetical protein
MSSRSTPRLAFGSGFQWEGRRRSSDEYEFREGLTWGELKHLAGRLARDTIIVGPAPLSCADEQDNVKADIMAFDVRTGEEMCVSRSR